MNKPVAFPVGSEVLVSALGTWTGSAGVVTRVFSPPVEAMLRVCYYVRLLDEREEIAFWDGELCAP